MSTHNRAVPLAIRAQYSQTTIQPPTWLARPMTRPHSASSQQRTFLCFPVPTPHGLQWTSPLGTGIPFGFLSRLSFERWMKFHWACNPPVRHSQGPAGGVPRRPPSECGRPGGTECRCDNRHDVSTVRCAQSRSRETVAALLVPSGRSGRRRPRLAHVGIAGATGAPRTPRVLVYRLGARLVDGPKLSGGNAIRDGESTCLPALAHERRQPGPHTRSIGRACVEINWSA